MKKVIFTLILIFGLLFQKTWTQEWEWYAHLSSSAGSVNVTSVFCPSSNSCVAVASFEGTVSWNGSPVYTSIGNMDIIVIKLDNEGDTLWTRRFGGTGKELPKDLTIDKSGNSYITGSFSNATNFGGTVLLTDGSEDVFLVKIATNGNVTWAKNVGWGPGLDRGNSVILDKSNNIHIIGFFNNSLYFDNDTLIWDGNTDNFYAKFNNNGNFLRASHFLNSKNTDRFNSISLANDGGTMISGFYGGSLKYTDPVKGLITVNTVGGDDAVLYKFDSQGNLEWVRTAGGVSADRGYDAATDILGNVYMIGYMSGTAKFDSSGASLRDSHPLTAISNGDFYVSKYNPEGTLQYVINKGGKGEDIGRSVDIEQNLMHIIGDFTDTIFVKNDTLASTSVTDKDLFLAALDLNGNWIGVGQMKGNGIETGQDIAYNGQGVELVGGNFMSTQLKIGTFTLNKVGTEDGIIARFSFPFRIAISENVNLTCFEGNNGRIIVTPYFGTPAYTYQWYRNSILQPAYTDSIVDNISSGTWKVIVADGNNNQDSADIIITQPPAIVINRSITNVSCFNGTDGAINITPSGGTPGYSYLWTTQDGSGLSPTAQDQDGLTGGNYNVRVTDSKGCNLDSMLHVNQPPVLNIEGFNKGDVTTGGAGNGWAKVLVAGGTTPYTYLWSNMATTDSIYNLDGGNYTVTVTDNYGCQDIDNVTINEPGILIVDLQIVNPISCNDSTDGEIIAIATGGVRPFTYTWTPDLGHGDTIATNLGGGWYKIKVDDSGSGTAYDSIYLLNPSALTVTKSIANVNCNGFCNGVVNITVVGGTPPYSYLWSRGDTREDLTGACQGLYTITVTDSHGCTKQSNAIITEPLALFHDFNVTDVTCYDENNGAINYTPSGGTPPYTYRWSNTITSQDLSYLFAGAYWVRLRDSRGCVDTGFVTVDQPAKLIVTAYEFKPSCFGLTDGVAVASVEGGTPGYDYIWDDMATQTDSMAENLDPNRIYEVQVTDGNGCITSDTTYIFESDMIEIDSVGGKDVTCAGIPNGSIDIEPSGGEAPFTYEWAPDGDTTEDIMNKGSGNYQLTVWDANNCIGISEQFTILDTIPQITIDSTKINNASCFGYSDGTITVYAAGGTPPLTYIISPGDSSNTNGKFVNLPAGDYTVEVTDANSCSVTTGTLTVGQPTAIVIDGTVIDVSCNGGSDGAITINISGGTPTYNCSWADGPTTCDRTDLTTDTYTLTVTDANGCIKDSTFIVNEPVILEIIDVDSIWDSDLKKGSICITAAGGTTPYSYHFTEGNDAIDSTKSENCVTYLAGGDYKIMVIDNNNCKDSVEVFALSTDKLFAESGISLYPNPTTGKLTVEIEARDHKGINLEILNMLGQVIWKKDLQYNGQPRFVEVIDMSQQAKGTYFMRLNGLPVHAKILLE